MHKHASKIEGAYDDGRNFGYSHRSCLAFARAMAAKLGVSARESDSICEEHAKAAGSIAGGADAPLLLA